MRRLMMAALLATCLAPAWAALTPFDSSSLARIEAAHRGKPFVVMLWSLDCVYCPANLATLSRASEAQGLNVVTIATDSLEHDGNAAAIAKKLGPRLTRTDAWAFGEAPPEQLRYAIDPKWRGETPRSYWYGANGVRRARSGPITPQLIEQFLQQR